MNVNTALFGIGSNSAEICLRLFKITGNQTEGSRFKQRSVITFWWLRNANHVKFIEFVMCTKKKFLVKKCLQTG